MHALIIEDEALIAIGVEDILRTCGFNSIAYASSPREAFEAVAERRPDLITSDDNLNPGSGIETVATIWEQGAIPTIFITGNVDAVTRHMHGSIKLLKPFTDASVKEAVEVVMSAPPAVAVLIAK